MALFSFYNVRKPRQYTHKPIYWDPHKEAMEDRIRKAEIKGSFIEGTSHLKKSRDRGDDRRSRTYKNVRLLVAAAVLAALFWFLFMQ